MPHAAHEHPLGTLPGRRHTLAARILRDFRRLTGGRSVPDRDRRCLIACSGGADSSALAIVLATLPHKPLLAHIVHDLRPPAEALADRDAARTLADRLGCPFAESAVHIQGLPGNAEANARRARLAALAEIARSHGLPFVATAHHADDALETMLLRLLRGCGPAGLGGIRAVRPLASGITLIRPMLALSRADARALCEIAGWAWREDGTNADLSRSRAALRHRVLPILSDIAPGAASRVARAAPLFDDAARLLAEHAAAVPTVVAPDGARSADRATLGAVPPVVAGAWLRAHASALSDSGTDRRTSAALAPILRVLREKTGQPREFDLRGVRVRVDARLVTLTPTRVHPDAPETLR